MFKNVAGQKMALYAFETGTGNTAGQPKNGEAGNLTFYVNKDWAGSNAFASSGITAVGGNASGWYVGDLSQAETNADALLFTGKSTTANVAVVGQLVYTVPPNFTALTINASGYADANIQMTNGVPIRNYDTGVQSQSGNIIRIASTDSLGNPIPASGQFAWHELNVVSGTGLNTRPRLRDWVSGYDYYVDPGTTPIPLNDSSLVLISPTTYRADVESINAVYASGVTTVNANVGTTQPVNFTGTGASANVKSDLQMIAGVASGATNLRDYTTGVHFMPVDTLMQNYSASGTTLTVKEPDGTTTAYTKTITTTTSTDGITATVKNP